VVSIRHFPLIHECYDYDSYKSEVCFRNCCRRQVVTTGLPLWKFLPLTIFFMNKGNRDIMLLKLFPHKLAEYMPSGTEIAW
jgi:hypothetical protein